VVNLTVFSRLYLTITLYDSIYNWVWDTQSIGWKIESKIIGIVYDAHSNLMSELFQLWISSAWENSQLFSYTYDGNSNQTGELSQLWNGSAWENFWQWIYTYDENNFITLNSMVPSQGRINTTGADCMFIILCG
jgi:hypothetical protein